MFFNLCGLSSVYSSTIVVYFSKVRNFRTVPKVSFELIIDQAAHGLMFNTVRAAKIYGVSQRTIERRIKYFKDNPAMSVYVEKKRLELMEKWHVELNESLRKTIGISDALVDDLVELNLEPRQKMSLLEKIIGKTKIQGELAIAMKALSLPSDMESVDDESSTSIESE